MNDAKLDGTARYQPLDPSTLNDPFPIFRRLQRDTPVFWHDGLYAWVLSRYHDCRRVLQHSEQFTRDRRKLGRPVPDDEMTIQTLDPPEQIALRQAVLHSLRQTDTTRACHEALASLERNLSCQPEGRPFDFMSEIAAPAAMRFACTLVGAVDISTESYRSIFLRLTRAMDREVYSQFRDAGVEATRELNGVIDAARGRAPHGSMIHELNDISDVAKMSKAYVRNTVSAAFNAAFSTAYSSMGSFLMLCLERQGLARQIVTSGQVSLGVNELLRFSSPAQSTARYATCDVVIAGVNVRQNDPIITLMAAANRDPEVFEHPDDLVLDRSPNPHLSFGYGPHHCVGAKPAEEFLSHFMDRLAEWEPRLTLATSPTWLNTATLRCLDTLPLSLKDGPR